MRPPREDPSSSYVNQVPFKGETCTYVHSRFGLHAHCIGEKALVPVL